MGTPRKESGTSKSGVADVKSTAAKVMVTFVDGGDNFVFPPEDVPEYMEDFNGRCFVATNRDQTTVVFAAPHKGQHLIRFKEFWHKENEPPQIDHDPGGRKLPTKKGGFWTTPEQFTFSVTYEIVAGEYKGWPMRQRFLPYDGFFQAEGEEGEPIAGVMDKRLEDWLAKVGYDFDTDTLPWSENVLVPLQKILRKRKKLITGQASESGFLKPEHLGETLAGIPADKLIEMFNSPEKVAAGVEEEEE
jgi:hypothetical protein